MPCTLSGNKAMINGISVKISDETAARAKNLKGEFEIGIRPVYIRLYDKEVKGGTEAEIKSVQDYGSYKIVSLMLAQNVIKAKLPENYPVPETRAWVEFPVEWVRLYADGKLV